MTDAKTTPAHTPTDAQVKEYMESHNADEVGEDNQWNMKEARYHLELDDEWYYKNKPAHTPAPWSIEDEQSRYIIRHDVMYVAEVVKESKEDKANATLMASAPELLEALEILSQQDCHCYDPKDKTCCTCMAIEAISRAKGNSPS